MLIKRSSPPDPVFITRFAELLRERVGLRLCAEDAPRVQEGLQARAKKLGLNTLAEYLVFLAGKDAKANAEWADVLRLVTNGESYFFRDRGQLGLLRNHLLPELVRLRERSRTLRLWSAGCSTGEEPHSLAMLLDEVIPNPEEWDLLVLGTDVNQAALETARQGCYPKWSFRGVAGPEMRWFRAAGDRWEVEERIRRRVLFRTHSLLSSETPDARFSDGYVDLVICRNVLIYFEPRAVGEAGRRLAAALAPGGYLVAGHSELHGQSLPGVQTLTYPEGIAYRRPLVPAGAARTTKDTKDTKGHTGARALGRSGESSGSGARSPANPGSAIPNSPSTARLQSAVPGALRAPQSGAPGYPLAGRGHRNPHTQTPTHPHTQHPTPNTQHPTPNTYQDAVRRADAGDHAAAEAWCRVAIAKEPFAAEPYGLLARLAEEQGRVDEAVQHWKKVLYLAPGAVAGYVELAMLYRQQGDAARARKMKETAVALLSKLPPDAPIEFLPHSTAGELLEGLKRS